ncbi:WXG100 family type VII secretion target [Mycobacterium kubicae]|nr:WXG100 family type VII secretion target [Mycobacterium kubicae]
MARFMTDPHAMRAMAGRFETHAQTVEDEARRMWASSQNISGAGWSGQASATSLDEQLEGTAAMTINYQFGDVDAHGALIRAQAANLEAEHQAIVRDVLAAGDFWGGAGSVACQEFITQLGRNFQVIYEQANSHGQKVQSAGSNMAQTDSAVGSSWA